MRRWAWVRYDWTRAQSAVEAMSPRQNQAAIQIFVPPRLLAYSKFALLKRSSSIREPGHASIQQRGQSQ